MKPVLHQHSMRCKLTCMCTCEQEIVPERIAPDLHNSTPRGPLRSFEFSTPGSHPADDVPSSSNADSAMGEAWKPYLETLHFFGVFDGHGGADAAAYCAQTLHQRIVEAVTATTSPPGSNRCVHMCM